MSYVVLPCSGCSSSIEGYPENTDGPWDAKNQMRLGAGCHECGYQGKRRVYFPDMPEDERKPAARGRR